MSVIPTKPVDPVEGKVPTEKEVSKFHSNADTDGGEKALHHSLGPLKGQAAPGDHDHRGGSSVAILRGETINGSKANLGGGGALESIIAILVELGATDNSTP